MLNPVASEALYSATYVDNYIDSVENLPDDVQRHLSRIRDIDVQYRSLLRDVDHYYDLWRSLQNTSDTNLNRRSRAIHRMQQSLIQAQELGDEKMQIVNLLQELIDHKTRQLDTDQKNLDIKEELQQQRAERELEECGVAPAPKQPRTQSPARSGGGSGNVGSEQPCLAANGSAIGVVVSGERQYNSNSNNGKDHNTNTFSGFAGSASSGGGGGSTPNSERSGHASNGTTGCGTAANGGAGIGPSVGAVNTSGSNLISSSDTQRAVSKRSRRRIDNNVSSTSGDGGNLEMAGIESNSANEAGGSNGNAVQRSSSGASGGTQKRSSTSNQSGAVAVGSATSGAGGASGSGVAAAVVGGGGNNAGKKKKRKARGAQSTSAQASAREDTPPPDPIDPDEPTYCVCNQISFGEMILCDNDLCPIEWFHFSCVSLVLKPKGKWFCPNCRGDRPNVMKPKAQFLKELERYNKEKEEKT